MYWELSFQEREVLTYLVVHADADGLVNVADMVITTHLSITEEDFVAAKKRLMTDNIKRWCSADKLLHIDMYTTGRFCFVWNQKRLPASQWQRLRSLVFERDNYTCSYCGQRGGKLECDHVHPVSRGGSHDEKNLTTSCKTCNQSKRDKTPEEWNR